MSEREKLKSLKKAAVEREDWKFCKELRNRIFEYDKKHPNEPSLALEVSLTKLSMEDFNKAMKKKIPSFFEASKS